MGNQTIKDVLHTYSAGGLTESVIKEATTPGNGPNVIVYDFGDNIQHGEYHMETNTIRLSKDLVEHFNSIFLDGTKSDLMKYSIAITLTQTFINEFTHYGDALDGLDAILNENGEVVNGPIEGGMIKVYDEGNDAAKALYPFYPSDTKTGKTVGSDDLKKNPSLIPPIK